MVIKCDEVAPSKWTSLAKHISNRIINKQRLPGENKPQQEANSNGPSQRYSQIPNGIAKTGLMADYPIWILKYFRVS